MLSEQERQRIQALSHGENKRAVVGEALIIVQENRGWVSDEGVADVADALGMTPDEVEGVATFFELVFRKPVGKHVILVCDSVSCWITGYDGILRHLMRRLGVGLGQTTENGLFTLLPAGCLGACEIAPVMMVDSELYGNLTSEAVDRIISRYEERADDDSAHR